MGHNEDLSKDRLGTITFPDEWGPLAWALLETVAACDIPGGQAFLAGGVLVDGTNLMGLCYPGGQRVARMSPQTGWSLEERFNDGDLMNSHAPLRAAWKVAVESMIHGKHAAIAEHGGAPGAGR